MGFGYETPFLPYGPRFRQARKYFHDVFQVKAAMHLYESLQRREVLVLLNSLMSKPDAFTSHFHRYVCTSSSYVSALKSP